MTLTEASAADAEPRPAVSEPLLTPQPAPSGTKRTPTLRRMFVLGAGVTALLMLIAIVSGAIALGRLSAARTVLLDEVGPPARANQDLARALLNQETGIRGFALSGDPTTLIPYRDGRTEEARAIEVLRGYLAQRPATAAPVDAVERAAAAWRTDYAEPVVTAGSGPGAPDPAVGKDLFDALRAPMAELTAVVDVERLAAREQLNDSADALRWVGLAIAAVMVLFLVAAAWGLRRGVLDPLSALAAQVRDLVTGDVRREVHAGGPREVVELGTDIEAMRRVISSEVDSLHDVNRLLDEQARDLERSNRDLEQFAYVASHDLQEPLRKVSSFCQLLQRRYGGQLDERADQYIEFAVDGAQRMQRLINDLLAFSRVGRTTSDFEPVDLREIGLAAAAQLDATRTELDGEIIIGELPQVQGDPALLRQLLLNLFGNGLKFHRPDTAPVVRADAQRTDDGWEISVVDNGIGIDPEYAEKVFVIFQRLHGRESYEGTGIGLALAKRIVEFHGGRIWLDTTPRQQPGTAIRFTLPFDVPSPGPASTPQEQQ